MVVKIVSGTAHHVGCAAHNNLHNLAMSPRKEAPTRSVGLVRLPDVARAGCWVGVTSSRCQKIMFADGRGRPRREHDLQAMPQRPRQPEPEARERAVSRVNATNPMSG